MYSQCPECLTRFRVTAAALRAAHGTVRCGRCGIAFDALPHLSDTLAELSSASTAADAPAALADVTGHATGPADDGTVVTEFHFSADDIEQVFVDARDWQRRFGETGPGSSTHEELAADLAAAAAAESAQQAADGATGAAPPGEDVFVHEPESVEDITLEGERIVIEGRPDDEESTEEFAGDDAERLPPPPGTEVEPDLDSTDRFDVLRIRAAAAAMSGEDVAVHPHGLPEDEFEKQVERALRQSQAAVMAAPASPPATPVTPEVAPLHAAPAEPSAPTGPQEPTAPMIPAAELARHAAHEDLQLDDEVTAPTRARGRQIAWGLGVLLLALVLAAQLTHHYRQELAREPFFGPPVRALYTRLGMPLTSNWNLGAFELQQWGASDSAPTSDGRLTIRASLRNRADFAQPMPLLRLELEDRYGGTVARRDFAPREYLKDPAQATRLLAPGMATEAEIAIVDASTDAVGYRLDVCLRDETAAVRCATAELADSSP
jgi:predicted Zn finger-like uncharacterized protein